MKWTLVVLAFVAACVPPVEQDCYDDLDEPIACEPLPDEPELPAAELPEPLEGSDAPGDELPGPDDLDGAANEAVIVPLDDDPETAGEAAPVTFAAGVSRVDVTAGRTSTAERRKLLRIGRTAGARRYVIMRLRPADLPNLAIGDVLRAAAELQVTTACDIGQTGPMCGYAPNVRMQLLLAGDPDETSAHGPGALALSDVKQFSCNVDDHHCVEVIRFSAATKTLRAANAPGCVADNSCFVNLVVWAYHPSARGSGKDKLIIGANEGNFLINGDSEQDRGRVMLVRERDVSPASKVLRVTKHDVKSGPISMFSDGDKHRIYSHTLAGGNDLRAGDKFRVWAEMNATSDHRVNVDIEMFLTKNRNDRNGGSLDRARPGQITEHNGTNCSPGNPCHLRKVAVFEVTRDVAGPVFVNITSSAEVPGPGSAHVTIHDNGFVKSVHYKQ